jgi:pimeloyl-ACP methyl ester carboxylesterase
MPTNFQLPKTSTSGITDFGTAWSRFGSGQSVVLLHGVGMNKNVWAPQVNDLGEDFDVLIFDMWGHGESALPNLKLELSDYTEQLTSLLDELEIESAHIVGHSMGALIAIDYALTQSCQSVSALNAVFMRTPEQSTAVRNRSAELSAGGVSVNLEETLQRWFGAPSEREHVHAANLARELLLAVNPQGYAAAYGVFASSDAVHANRLGELKIPSLFFTADGDPNSTPAMSQAMADLAPNGTAKVLAGHRHMMTLTAPELVSESLRAFFNSVSKIATKP